MAAPVLSLFASRTRASGLTDSNCGSSEGREFTREQAERLAVRFFVRGTITRAEFGAAPAIQFNDLSQPAS